jgi:hypothetical protein
MRRESGAEGGAPHRAVREMPGRSRPAIVSITSARYPLVARLGVSDPQCPTAGDPFARCPIGTVGTSFIIGGPVTGRSQVVIRAYADSYGGCCGLFPHRGPAAEQLPDPTTLRCRRPSPSIVANDVGRPARRYGVRTGEA